MRLNYFSTAGCRAMWFFGGLLATGSQAHAHHPMGGQLPSNVFEGMLSGLGHPIIGLDHLAFIIGVGLLSLTLSKSSKYLTPAAFIGTTGIGAVVHLYGVNLPLAEALVALSVLGVGALVFTRYQMPSFSVPALGAIAGVLHGYAYGEAIIGAETSPLLAYFVGFYIIQATIVALAMWLMHKFLIKQLSHLKAARWSGAVISALGLTFLFLQFS